MKFSVRMKTLATSVLLAGMPVVPAFAQGGGAGSNGGSNAASGAVSGAASGGVSGADSARLDEIARDAARRFAEERGATALSQTRPNAPQLAPGTRVELTMEQAVTRALERNLDIAVERINPQTFDFSISALNANYRPTLTSNFGLRSQSSFVRSTTAGATNSLGLLDTDTLTGNTGMTQNMKWGGGSYAVAWNNNRQAQSDAFAFRNPSISTNLTAAFVQPLLRNFRTDGNRATLRITQINREISETTLRATIVRTLANVRNAYWDYVYTIQAADVAAGSLNLASKLVEDNQARVEVGTLAPLDVVQAQAEQATRRQAVATTSAALRTAELALKRLIVNGTEDPFWSASIEPVDRPTYSTEAIDVEAAVRRALANRTDIETSKRTLESNEVSLKNLGDQQLPVLDLTLSYGAAGIGGPTFIRQTGQIGGAVTQTIPSGYSDALSLLRNFDAPTWNVAVNFSYPIGSSPAEANLARARLQRQQTVAQGRQLELTVATEVANAALQVESNRERLQAAVAARELAERRLEAEQSRFEVGLTTNFFVVQGQRDLRDAQNSELRALLDYRRAQVDFERVQEVPAGGSAGVTAIQPGGGQASRATAGGGGGGF
jgi:outer membrane protein TolC